MEFLNVVLDKVTGICIPVFELIAIIVVLITVVLSFAGYVRSLAGKNSSNPEHRLSKGLSLALEFFMAAEILKTVTLQEKEELLILAAVIIFRILFSFLTHFEMKQSNKNHHEEEKS